MASESLNYVPSVNAMMQFLKTSDFYVIKKIIISSRHFQRGSDLWFWPRYQDKYNCLKSEFFKETLWAKENCFW